MLNPVDTYREGKQEKLLCELQKLSAEDLQKIIKKFMPDMSRKMYRCKNCQKLIDYICFRSESLATKGDVFYTTKS